MNILGIVITFLTKWNGVSVLKILKMYSFFAHLFLVN